MDINGIYNIFYLSVLNYIAFLTVSFATCIITLLVETLVITFIKKYKPK
jgi:hypothetical protein